MSRFEFFLSKKVFNIIFEMLGKNNYCTGE
jgi:hypothetical protein